MTNLDGKAGKEAEEKELYDAFTQLGSDPELSDVEFAFQAQAEVALLDRVASVATGLNPRASEKQLPAFAGRRGSATRERRVGGRGGRGDPAPTNDGGIGA